MGGGEGRVDRGEGFFEGNDVCGIGLEEPGLF